MGEKAAFCPNCQLYVGRGPNGEPTGLDVCVICGRSPEEFVLPLWLWTARLGCYALLLDLEDARLAPTLAGDLGQVRGLITEAVKLLEGLKERIAPEVPEDPEPRQAAMDITNSEKAQTLVMFMSSYAAATAMGEEVREAQKAAIETIARLTKTLPLPLAQSTLSRVRSWIKRDSPEEPSELARQLWARYRQMAGSPPNVE